MPAFADLRTPQLLNEYILVMYSPNVIITIFNNSLQEACGVTKPTNMPYLLGAGNKLLKIQNERVTFSITLSPV
jgi:hypothetical protein